MGKVAGDEDDVLDLSLKQSHSTACNTSLHGRNDVGISSSGTPSFSSAAAVTSSVTSSPVIEQRSTENYFTQASRCSGDDMSSTDEDGTDRITYTASVVPAAAAAAALFSGSSTTITGGFPLHVNPRLTYSRQTYPPAIATTPGYPPLLDLFAPSDSSSAPIMSMFTGSVSDSRRSTLKRVRQHSGQAGGCEEVLEDNGSDTLQQQQQQSRFKHQLSLTSSERCSSEPLRLQSSDDIDDEVAYVERRRKNNEAAKRSRDARRLKEQQTALRAAALEQENVQLRAELAVLRNQAAKLHCLLYNKLEI